MKKTKESYDKYKKIIIFGAGVTGEFVYDTLKKHGIKVDAFCDNVLGGKGKKNGIPILRLEEITKKNTENMLIIISVRDIETIVKQLEGAGRYKYCSLLEIYDLEDIPKKKTFMEKQKLEAAWYVHKHYIDKENLCLDTLDLVITERCSLNCKECSNLMQYYAKPIDYPLECIKKDVDNVLKIFKEIYEVRIIGGEPFMNKEIEDIISFLNHKFEVKRICIYTNGTIPLSNQQLENIKNKGKTWFSISDYGKLSRNIEGLIAVLNENEIGFERKKIEYWTKCASFNKHNRSIDQLKKIYYECCAKKLVTLLKGRIYPCPFIANAINLEAIPAKKTNFVDIADKNDINNKVKELLKDRKYFDLCDYCMGRPSVAFVKDKDKIKPCEQITMKLEYERIKNGEE